MVNLEWYRTFKAIYEKGTLTSAAEALCISQPGVSLHLSSLENHVGAKLFDRASKKMIATERGKVLYNALQDPLSKLESIEKQFQRSTEKDTPTLSIGMCFEMFQHSLEKHLHKFNFNVITQFADYSELLQRLEKGLVDLVITPHKIEVKGIQLVPFGKETILLIGSRENDAKHFRTLLNPEDSNALLNWMRTQKWYGSSSDHEHFKRFWIQNFGTAPDFRPNFIVPNFKSIVRSLSIGSGLAIVPDFLCREEVEKGDLVVLWKGYKKITNQLYFAYRKNSIYQKEINCIWEIFDENK